VYQGFKLVTGKEGMGYGDFKLFAALGAWFGWSALVPMILMASVIGRRDRYRAEVLERPARRRPNPLRSLPGGAGLTVMVFGPDVILRVIGL
jgi:leader peptidase (prepilin peptidase)/N-methyltransferase